MTAPSAPAATLPLEAGALLFCIRRWVADVRHPRAGGEPASDLLRRLGAGPAGPFLDGMMFAVRHGAARPLGIGCMCHPRVTADEQVLLDAAGLAQERRPFEALLALRAILTPAAARAALQSAEKLGAALACAGLFLPAPDAAMRQTALQEAVSGTDGGRG